MAKDHLVCLWGAPSPVYKGGEEGACRPSWCAPKGGFLLLLGLGFPPFLVLMGGGRKGKRRRRKGGSPP